MRAADRGIGTNGLPERAPMARDVRAWTRKRKGQAIQVQR
jgi:hypothetical protein